MCCGSTYTPSARTAAGAPSGWTGGGGGGQDLYAVLPRGEQVERVVGSYAEAVTATARGGSMRPVSAAEAERIKSMNPQSG